MSYRIPLLFFCFGRCLIDLSPPSGHFNISNAKWYLCGLETFLLGGACATVAYSIGQYVDHLVD